jgi:hypothetical protein
VLDAIVDLTQSRVPTTPNTGNVHDDLMIYFGAIVAGLRDPQVRTLIRSLIALPDHEIADERRAFWQVRFDTTAQILRAGMERGELPPDTDIDRFIESVGGPIWMRLLIVGDDLDDAHLERLVREAIERASQQ